nr:MAG TPA: hypothetical protein [Caudoviricetes sp.]
MRLSDLHTRLSLTYLLFMVSILFVRLQIKLLCF